MPEDRFSVFTSTVKAVLSSAQGAQANAEEKLYVPKGATVKYGLFDFTF